MRYPVDQKEITREKIVAAASHALRRDGLGGVSIPALMKKVGLTHGGFYNHFADRDELVAEAVRAAGRKTAERVFEQSSFKGMLNVYLSLEHAQHPGEGCVLAALGTDSIRQSAPVRRAFAETARGFIRYVQNKLSPCPKRQSQSDEALTLASTLIGAVILARLVDDKKLAERILATARKNAPRPEAA